MHYPNNPEWSALKSGIIHNVDQSIKLSTISCGKLKLPSGQLMVCDPFAGLSKSNNAYVQITPGEFEVIVTLADVSPDLNGSHMREAYASLILDPQAEERTRKFLEPTRDGKPSGELLKPGEYYGYSVDAGTACFADAQTVHADMPEDDNWYEELFENESSDCWFEQMDVFRSSESARCLLSSPTSFQEK